LQRSGLLAGGAKAIDFGAGSGLLVRLLRDQGFDALGYDKFTEMALCRGFHIADLSTQEDFKAGMVTAVEVFEHVPCPYETVRLLRRNLAPGGMILLTTRLYDPRHCDSQWDYLSPENGQHINFFSRRGLEMLAGRFEMKAIFLPFGFHILASCDTRVGTVKRSMIGLLATAYFVLARLVGLCDFRYCQRDNQALAQRHPGKE
jgi:hypothetical protein